MRIEQKSTFDVEHLVNIRRLFRNTLSAFVGPGRLYPVEVVAAATQMKPDTIRRYLRGESCPEWHNAVAIMGVLPPEFANTILHPAGLTGLRRIGGECTAAETLREVAEGAAVLASALADGRIDHTELPAIRKELTEALVAISQFLQAEICPQ